MAGRVELPVRITSAIASDPRRLAAAIQRNFDALAGAAGSIQSDVQHVEEQVIDWTSRIEEPQHNPGAIVDEALDEAPDYAVGDGLVPDPPAVEPVFLQGPGVNILDMRAYYTQNQAATGAPAPDIELFLVEVSTSDDNGGSWSAFSEVSRAGAIFVHGDLSFEILPHDPGEAPENNRRLYKYKYRVKDVEGNLSDYSDENSDPKAAQVVSADMVETLVLSAAKIYSPDVTGQRLEIGDELKPILFWDGTGEGTKFYLDSSGSVYVAGQLDFGDGSRITEDFVEFQEQPTGFATPIRIQSSFEFAQNVSSITGSWSAPTTHGSFLIAYVMTEQEPSHPTHTTPAGWTLLGSGISGDLRTSWYYISNASSRSGDQTINFSGTVDGATMKLIEYSGIDDIDQTNVVTGTTSPANTGTTATTTQAEEAWLVFFTGLWTSAVSVPWIGDPDNGYVKTGSNSWAWDITPEGHVLREAHKIVTATGDPDVTQAYETGKMSNWVTLLVTIKAKDTSTVPSTPASGKIRVYNRADKLAYKDDGGSERILTEAWPIGSVFTSVVSTDPADLLGFGTWSQIAQGRMLVGQNSGDTDFDTAEETGGSKTQFFTTNIAPFDSGGPSALANDRAAGAQPRVGSNHTHEVNPPATASDTKSIMNPYFVVYFWKRTA